MRHPDRPDTDSLAAVWGVFDGDRRVLISEWPWARQKVDENGYTMRKMSARELREIRHE